MWIFISRTLPEFCPLPISAFVLLSLFSPFSFSLSLYTYQTMSNFICLSFFSLSHVHTIAKNFARIHPLWTHQFYFTFFLCDDFLSLPFCLRCDIPMFFFALGHVCPNFYDFAICFAFNTIGQVVCSMVYVFVPMWLRNKPGYVIHEI